MLTYPLCLDPGRFTKSAVVQSRISYLQAQLHRRVEADLRNYPHSTAFFYSWSTIAGAARIDEADAMRMLGGYSGNSAGLDILVTAR